MARRCVFCGTSPVTREHVFRRSYKRMLGLKGYDRAFAQRLGNASLVTIRTDPMFEAQVKRVCRACNNGWMNRLDHAVESWISDPAGSLVSDVDSFRRWAIKTAVMRTMLDNPGVVPTEDLHTVFHGGDVADWHVFVGHAQTSEFRHAYACMGPWEAQSGVLLHGIIQVSWVLGTAVVCALRNVGAGSGNYLDAFERFNASLGWPLAEVTTGGVFPALMYRPQLLLERVPAVFWFFTPEPVSPVAAEIRHSLASFRATANP